MAFETKKDRNGETTDVWEKILTRRLADDLDAFLEEANDKTFFFADETNARLRTKEIGKKLRFKTLATVAASAAFLCGVASTTRVYIASRQAENVVESQTVGAKTSLLAWSVENLSDTPWARRVETTLASADVFGLYASPTEESEAKRFASGLKNDGGEENVATEVASNDWFSVESLSAVANSEPLKYEPFLQALAASLL